MSKVIARVKLFLQDRKRAYVQVFKDEDVAVDAVMKDLEKFCRANETTFSKDDRIHALLEGRREVFLRIQSYVNLTPDELWELYGKE